MDKPDRRAAAFLVGAGPGDEGLIAVRGVEVLRMAETLIYDALVNPSLLRHCPDGCEMIYAGKKAGAHTLKQEEINRLLVEKVRRGRIVVRLKGGDPFVFGRGGEEALALSDAQLPFEIVPGVTAATAAGAYAGIPLTHRGMASSVALVTGHEDPTREKSDIDWERLATAVGTLAFYMGVKNLPEIAERLIAHGRSPGTPAALIQWGTLERQRTVTADLASIAARAREHGIEPPALLVIGETVRLRERLRWFDRRPLSGRRIVVTRSREQGSLLAGRLRELGAEVVPFPTIGIAPIGMTPQIERLLAELDRFSWLLFTSTNGVDLFFRRLFESGRDVRALGGLRIGAIGTGTATALQRHGIRADLVPQRYTSEGLLEAFRERGVDLQGRRVLLPGSDLSRDLLPEGLERMGAETVRLPLYRTFCPEYGPEEIAAVFDPLPDLVTFTSASTIRNLVDVLQRSGAVELVPELKGVSIGPVTSREARELGVDIVAEANPHTIPALVEAVERVTAGKEAS